MYEAGRQRLTTGATMTPPAGVLKGLSAAACLALAAGLGLWISLHYSLVAFKADPDIYTTVALWRGVQAHGLGFVKSWLNTQDNWIFSLLPIDAAVYSAIGAAPRTVVLTGWVFFLVSVGLTAWLAGRLTNARIGLTLGAVLLFANYHALGHIGFLAYPISHNVSCAWGLLALILAVEGLKRCAYGPCVAAAVVLYFDVVSDPWASAAIGLPLFAAAAVVAFIHRGTPLGARALALSGAAMTAQWAAIAHPFGLLHFLPKTGFAFGGRHALMENARLGGRALAVMFNIVPGVNLEEPWAQWAALAALTVVLAGAFGLALRGYRKAGAATQLVVAAAALSIGMVGGLYLLGAPNSGMYVGRFFPNLYFLGALLAAVAAGASDDPPTRTFKALASVYAALFIASGMAMAPRAWTGPVPPSEPAEGVALGQVLQQHGLRYGYGGYWGSSALAMGELTHGAVTIRPVVFQASRIVGRPIGASRLWYAPGAEPRGVTPFLVIRSDIENCPSVSACEAVARRQFGEPAQRLTSGDAVVLVWNHPLAPAL